MVALDFVAVTALNSVLVLDKGFVKLISKLSATFLAMAMAALGLDTDLGKIKALGARPVVLALTVGIPARCRRWRGACAGARAP